jgi:outer membrane receptor protein involved in Fe transport
VYLKPHLATLGGVLLFVGTPSGFEASLIASPRDAGERDSKEASIAGEPAPAPAPAPVTVTEIETETERETETQTATAIVFGMVRGPSGEPLSGVTVTLAPVGLAPAASDPRVHVTGPLGQFHFSELTAGRYRLVAALAGYQDFMDDDIVIIDGAIEQVAIAMDLAPFSESVVIQAVAGRDVNVPDKTVEFRIEDLELLPLPTDRFQEAFPLIPGVVRDSEGRLSFFGARPSQSSLLVNGANVTDPLTGEFAVEIPLKAIEAVEVNTIPYSAQYGKATAAVAEIDTRGGTDEWEFELNNPFPRPNFRGGQIRGISSAIPQIQISGPLQKGRAWLRQAFTYRFVRSRAYDVPIGEDERVLESYDIFSQFDLRLGEKHHLTSTLSHFPVEVDNLGLTALSPDEATPDYSSSGWNAAVSLRSYFSRTVLETIVSGKSLDVSVKPKFEGDARLTPEGLRGNYFNALDRDSARYEVATSCSHAIPEWFGEHVLKFGGSVSTTSFRGTDQGLPIDVFGSDGSRTRRIEFVGSPDVGGSDVQVAGFIQDQWRPSPRFGIDLGIRYDYDYLVTEHQVAPRMAVAYSLDSEGLSILKGGFGIFYDHVFLHSDSFDRSQSRLETWYGADGRVLRSILFRPTVLREELEMPRSWAWNVEWSRVLRPGVELRINYRELRGTEEMVVERIEGSGTRDGRLRLSSGGKSRSRGFDVTLRVARTDSRELFASYVASRSTADLNNFGTLYQNLRSPLLLSNENARGDFDVPHRFLFWGVWKLPKDVIVTPGVEWRSGFPYTIQDELYEPVGERNASGRFPTFFSADVRVTKGFTVLGRNVRVGLQARNLGSHFNPRDAVTHVGSARFGELLNSVDMRLSLRFRVMF